MNLLQIFRKSLGFLALMTISISLFGAQNMFSKNVYADNTKIANKPTAEQLSSAVKIPYDINRFSNKLADGTEKINIKNRIPVEKAKNKIMEYNPDDLPGIMAGFTFYDFQTNACMSERLAYFDAGGVPVMQLVWMSDDEGTESGWANRGTFYEILDFSNPYEPETAGLWDQKMENTRAGWPSILQFSDGSIGSPSHHPAANTSEKDKLLFAKNATFQGTNFSTKTIDQEKSMMWPHAVLDGKGYIHMIHTYNDTLQKDLYGQVGYMRSTDNGATWSTDLVFTGELAFDGATTNGSGGDAYALAARGNDVVVVYNDDKDYYMQRKSTDNGVTWSAPKIIASWSYKYQITEDLGGGRYRFTSDTVLYPANQMDVIIDNAGNAHYVGGVVGRAHQGIGVVEGEELISVEEGSDSTLGFYYYAIGLLYQFDGSGAGWNVFGNPQGEGTENYGGASKINVRGGSPAAWPQLGVDDEDNIYCVYSGVQIGDFTEVNWTSETAGPQTESALFGHLYITHRLNGTAGNEWSTPKNLSPTGADCLFPSMCNDVVTDENDRKWMYVAYSVDATPGDRVTNTGLVEDDEYTWIYVAAIPVDTLNEYQVSVKDDIDKNNSVFRIQPNPVKDRAEIYLNIDNSSNLAIGLYDLMGRKVLDIYNGEMQAGSRAVSFRTDKLAPGVYYCRVNLKGENISKKIIVTH